MQILLQIVKYDNKDSLITVNNIDEICNGIKKSSVLFNNEMRSLLNKFAEKCYCEGNFFAIPFKSGFSLNRAKAKLKLQGYQYTFVDSSDTYFKVCYDYFVNGQNVCQLTKLIDLKYEMWKERYRHNWGLFISDNCFQDFMDLDGKPLRLWNKSEDGFSRDLKNYLRKAIDVLSKREERVCIKL